MSKALKCNKCEACFDPANTEAYFVSFKDVIIRNSKTYSETKIEYATHDFDLCPRCSAEFLDWSKLIGRLRTTVANEEKERAVQEKINGLLDSRPDDATDLLKKMRSIASSLWREPITKKEV